MTSVYRGLFSPRGKTLGTRLYIIPQIRKWEWTRFQVEANCKDLNTAFERFQNDISYNHDLKCRALILIQLARPSKTELQSMEQAGWISMPNIMHVNEALQNEILKRIKTPSELTNLRYKFTKQWINYDYLVFTWLWITSNKKDCVRKESGLE